MIATPETGTETTAPPVVSLRGAGLTHGTRELWQNLDLDVGAGEFLAVLGPNGSGKTSLVKVLLGLMNLSSGTARVGGLSPRRGNNTIGYIPQQKGFDRDLSVRGVDLVRLGLDGHRWGIGWPSRVRRNRVAAAMDAVGASGFADAPIGRLSGGEQQRLRIAQAILSDPELLLCDEPLLSLDLKHQRAVVDALDHQRRSRNVAVVFVTHEINPILPVTDRVLYLVGRRWAVGTPAEVLTGDTLSELYQTTVEVLRVQGRIVIVGAPTAVHRGTAHDDMVAAE